MKLIVNADDFGMSAGVNYGILECFKKGIVTSTSMMVNTPGFEHGIELMKENKLDVGIHFVLTIRSPLTNPIEIPTIVNEKGEFEHNIKKLDSANKDEIRLELMAQLNKFMNTGFTPSHIDFHHEVNFAKNALEVAIEIAKEYNLPMRAFEPNSISKMNEAGVKHSKRFLYEFTGKDLTIEKFICEVNKAKGEELAEIMTHPAYLDTYLQNFSSYNLQRIKELEILTSDEVKEFIKENKIELVGFGDIR